MATDYSKYVILTKDEDVFFADNRKEIEAIPFGVYLYEFKKKLVHEQPSQPKGVCLDYLLEDTAQ